MRFCCSKKYETCNKTKDLIKLFKALTEQTRLCILCILSKKEICVCELAKELKVSHNLLSHHLKSLSDVEILDKRRDGNQFFYFIKPEQKEKINHFLQFIQD